MTKVLTCVLAVTALGFSQAHEPAYQAKAEITITGTVTAVTLHTGQRGTPRARATVKTADGTEQIHIGPSSFLREKRMELAVGDRITVTGSRTESMLIVRRLGRGTQVLDLRNAEGRPLWEERHK